MRVENWKSRFFLEPCVHMSLLLCVLEYAKYSLEHEHELYFRMEESIHEFTENKNRVVEGTVSEILSDPPMPDSRQYL